MTELAYGSVELVVCAAPLAERAHEIAAHLVAAGYSVEVTTTPTADGWVDAVAVEAVTRRAPASAQRRREQLRSAAKPANVLALPLTFNSLNQWAVGASDSRALGALNSAFGSGARMVAVPMVNERLWAHPALAEHIDRLRGAGVTFLDAHNGEVGVSVVASGTGEAVASAFDPAWIVPHLAPLTV